MKTTKSKSVNGYACVLVELFNKPEYARIVPLSARYKLGQRGYRYIATDNETGFDLYDSPDGILHAIPTGKGY